MILARRTGSGLWVPTHRIVDLPQGRIRTLTAGIATRRGDVREVRHLVPHPFLPDKFVWQMASSVSALTQGNGDTEPAVTASISPTGNSVVIVCSLAIHDGAQEPGALTVTGGGMTSWTSTNTGDPVTDSTSTHTRMDVAQSLQASPGSGTVSLDYAGPHQDHFIWHIFEISEVNTTTPITQSKALAVADGTPATSLETTFDAAFGDATNNLTVQCGSLFVDGSSPTISFSSELTYTDIGDESATDSVFAAIDIGYRTGEDASPTVTASVSSYLMHTVLEIDNDAGGGGLGIPIAAYHHFHHNLA